MLPCSNSSRKVKHVHSEAILAEADLAIVGAGILGLACAWTASRAGMRVAVIERSPRAAAASVRNFGMVWPVGQARERVLPRALRSRALWLEMLAETGLWHDRCGSLHLARSPEEEAVLGEFAELGGQFGYRAELLSPDETLRRYPAVRRQGLRAALFSDTEACVDPRQIVWELPAFLRERHRTSFLHGHQAIAVNESGVTTSRGKVRAKRTIVCSGSDFETLFPEQYAAAGLARCKLQMMRTPPQPNGWRIGVMIAGGLTLLHYACFEICPSLPALRQCLEMQFPEYRKHGIHVMASQNGLGEVVIGDSHEYGLQLSEYDSTQIDELILQYLGDLIELPDPRIAERWHGIYTIHRSRTEYVHDPMPNVRLASFTSGNGMTTSFGLAEEILADWIE